MDAFPDAEEAAKFDNRYYELITDRGIEWNQVDKSGETGHPDERWQWDGFKSGTQVKKSYYIFLEW